jgi:hypothetical protein
LDRRGRVGHRVDAAFDPIEQIPNQRLHYSRSFSEAMNYPSQVRA